MPRTNFISLFRLALAFIPGFAAVQGAGLAAQLENAVLRFQLAPETGACEILDKPAGVAWRANPLQPRFGEATVNIAGQRQRVPLGRCEVKSAGPTLEAVFRPSTNLPAATLRFTVRLRPDAGTLEFVYEADPALAVENVRLLDNFLWTTDAERGYAVVPVREGLLVPADSGRAFNHTFNTFDYEGCHMEMMGMVKNGAAALVTWHEPYIGVEMKSVLTNGVPAPGRQALFAGVVLNKSARAVRVQFIGKGDYVSLAAAYRPRAAEKGWLVPWADKLKSCPDRAKLFGAVNFKLWSALSRQMNDDSSKEVRTRLNWTFGEAAQVAEHLKNDLRLDKVLFTVGGWIKRGYDNQHPDILPAAPECGGDAALADCARRVMDLGYLFCLHDNYQDIYRDSPSWNEDYIMKQADGQLRAGGSWAGGRAYLTCSLKAVELAKRPQNLPAVRKLTGANSYFIDTTYAAGLYECLDSKHPLTKWDDLKWKQAISDYAREVFGVFGSECGREWALPHADFFEGLTGVSGRHYHDTGLEAKVGGVVVPLFELVYRDGIALYGKYGYDPGQAAEYVLDHISLGRPLNYHNVPAHLYWQEPARPDATLALRPAVAELQPTGPRRFRITYEWTVDKTPAADWNIFVHFTDKAGKILFQNDHPAQPPVTQWQPGRVRLGPFTVEVPEGLAGTYDIRIGLFQTVPGRRAQLIGRNDGEGRYVIGKIKVEGDQVAFEPPAGWAARNLGDPSVFTHAEGGWAEGLHPLDRFVKNTYEILSPLNEITAQKPMTRHEFLTPDRKVRRSVFGAGASAVEVVVNASQAEYRCASKLGGDVLLPVYGFLIEGPTLIAFHASSWNGLRYDAPVFFTVRSLDQQPLNSSGKVRVYHGFGDPRLRFGAATKSVSKEVLLRPGEAVP